MAPPRSSERGPVEALPAITSLVKLKMPSALK